MKITFQDLIEACTKLKGVIIHGEEPFKFMVDEGKWIPENLIINTTKQLSQGTCISNNW